ncbi:DUF998 domain-containing protein [Rhodococcus spelaei]|uniref:DUF998 domain-containing protein n=1 Tax=Rhodococcus spelaei TaxID=2546320 RepID=UPI0015EEBC77|nr:DUF998 domain-containing protein [Rhodococcus spelaei]
MEAIARTTDHEAAGVARAGAAWWTPISSAAAPLLLIGGWVAAGSRQPPTYSPVRQSISVLSGDAATDQWVMTTALIAVGLCHLLTAAGLYGIRPAARIVLAASGLAGIAMAMIPQPEVGSIPAHVALAVLGAITLALWPAFVGSRAHRWPSLLSVRMCTIATLVFVVMTVWLLIEAQGGANFGLSERICTSIESSWPFLVVLAVRRAAV